MNLGNFFAELKRRNVYKAAVGYAVIGWLLIQIATQVFPFFDISNTAVRLVVVVIIIGFPIALVIAWAFEMTPEGMKRTDNVSPNARLPQWSRRKFALFVAVTAVLAASLLVFQLLRPKPTAKLASAS
jgi:adenylate cyclase